MRRDHAPPRSGRTGSECTHADGSHGPCAPADLRFRRTDCPFSREGKNQETSPHVCSRGVEASLPEGFALESSLSTICAATQDKAGGSEAFLAKRITMVFWPLPLRDFPRVSRFRTCNLPRKPLFLAFPKRSEGFLDPGAVFPSRDARRGAWRPP
jgi:hypothetical protein